MLTLKVKPVLKCPTVSNRSNLITRNLHWPRVRLATANRLFNKGKVKGRRWCGYWQYTGIVSGRVEHFAIFEKFTITSWISRIPMEHIDSICSLESELFFVSICSIRILYILKVIAKTSFSKTSKYSTLVSAARYCTGWRWQSARRVRSKMSIW